MKVQTIARLSGDNFAAALLDAFALVRMVWPMIHRQPNRFSVCDQDRPIANVNVRIMLMSKEVKEGPAVAEVGQVNGVFTKESDQGG